MPLVPLQQILGRARAGGYAVGYFEAWDACSLEAVLIAAEEESAPVILGFGAMMVDAAWLDSGGVEVLGAIGGAYAARSSVDVALLFNEAHTLEQAKRGIDAGFNAVMIDTHSWPTEDAIVAVRELCRVAHQSGVAVEGELGSPAEATASGVDHSHAKPHGSGRGRALRRGDRSRLPGSFSRECPYHDGGRRRRSTWNACDRSTSESTCRWSSMAAPVSPLRRVAPAIALGVAKFNVGTVLKHEFWGGLESAVRCRRYSSRRAQATGIPQGLRCDAYRCRRG